MHAVSEALEFLLHEAVREGTCPGAVAAVSVRGPHEEERVFARAGLLAPGGGPTEVETPYDLASLTKPVVAVTALRLAQRGTLDLAQRAAEIVPELTGTVGGESSLSALLSHRAGLSPWGGLYKELPGRFGSTETRAFMLREAASRRDPKPRPGSVYSDFGYLVAGEVVARSSGVGLARAVAREVAEPLGIANELFYAAALLEDERLALAARAAPTELCPFRGRVLCGEVHDENCAAFGGIAGHAGLFGTASAVLTFARAVLDALEGRSLFLDRALVTWALRPQPLGGYVVGWDAKSSEGSSAGSLLSPRSFGHLGFTGTSVWCDPARSLCAVLLSNRVHPTRDNIAIRSFRPRFHDGIVRALQR